jgi:hypothetical protein
MLAGGYTVLPADKRVQSTQRFDVVGTVLLALGLGLLNFAWNQGPVAGWSTIYVWIVLLVSALVFVLFVLWERRVGDQALIPTALMQKNNLLVFVSLWLGWMSLGIYWFYMFLLCVSFVLSTAGAHPFFSLRNVKGVDSTLSLAAHVLPVVPVGSSVA